MSQRTLHPWEKPWLHIIRSYADASRFKKGVSYVRSGAVLKLTVEPGVVNAQVRGSRRTPYETRIYAPIMSADELLVLPLHHIAELLTHRSEDSLLDEIIAAAPGIIPDKFDIDFSCTCPDWGYPCKHAVATALSFSDLFQNGLSAFLTFRGVDNMVLVQAMMQLAQPLARHGKSTPRSVHVPAQVPVQAPRHAATPDGVHGVQLRKTLRSSSPQLDPLQVDARRFWQGEELPAGDHFRIAQGPAQSPEWVLHPPISWPDRKGIPTYLEVISWAYDLLNDPETYWGEVE